MVEPTPLKNDGVSNSWDDDIPNIWKVIKFIFQTTNQMSLIDFQIDQIVVFPLTQDDLYGLANN